MKCTTLSELLRKNKDSHHTGITFIESSDQEIFLSYAALYQEALKSLAVLQNSGMNAGDELVLQVSDNKTFVIGFWAAILGGFIPVPLAAAQTAEQKHKLFNVWKILNRPFLLIADTELKHVEVFATENDCMPLYRGMEEHVIFGQTLLLSSDEGKLATVQEKEIAFVQFSSGSTGLPKGVVLTHENLLANMEGIANAGGYEKDDRMLSWMPLTHDMGLIGFHLNPLYSGINQYLMPTALFVRRPGLWFAKASEHAISILCSPNFGYEYLLKHLSTQGKQNWNLSNVRIIYNGAEPISATLCARFVETLAAYGLSRNAICPVYGLAEASVAVAISGMQDEVIVVHLHRDHLSPGSSIALVSNPDDDAVTFVNVGRAIDHCELRIANEDDIVVSEFIIGHVHIKGRNVTGGYYNNKNESLTAIASDGWLKTGDLGFLLDGALYITGRKKDIFFINGQNYYPHDIERVAEESAGFELNKIAVAGWFNNTTQQEEVIAFVAHRGNIESFVPLVKLLKAVINTRTGLVISRILPIKQIPKTTSGKLQRFRLIERLRNGDFEKIEQELQSVIVGTENSVVADTSLYNAVERQLLDLYRQVLDGKDIGIDESFFEAGGNSLKSAELAMLMLKFFEIELSSKVLYSNPTVRMLAAVIDQLQKQTYTPLPSADKQTYYPVSFAQKRLYYAWELDNMGTAYNVPVCIKIKGAVNADRLEFCIRQLIDRHEVLRMSFQRITEPVFSIAGSVEFELNRLNCTAEHIDAMLLQLVEPFDLNSGKLFRFTLLNTDVTEYILFADFHHIIADGISISIFIRELLDLYDGKELVALSTIYTDFACWEKVHAVINDDAAALYWRQQLQSPIPVLELSANQRRPAVFNYRGARKTFQFDDATDAGLRQLAKQYGYTLHGLLLTLYYILLYKYSGKGDIIVGIAVAGRNHPDLQGLMGMFVNNLAIREQISGEQKFTDLLQHVNHTIDNAFDYQDYPFDAVVKLADNRQEAGRNPVFDTMFLFQHFHLPETSPVDFTCSHYPFNTGSARFDLSIEVKEMGRKLQYEFEYATSLFDESFIDSLGRSFACLARTVLTDPHQTVAVLPLLDVNEYEEIIELFNHTGQAFPKEKSIHRLFEEQVQRTPDAIAIEYNGCKINYAQLNKEANEMALLLRSKGAANGSITALLLPRSIELVVSILAVLKTGSAYLPIDIELPAERIRFMLSDSKSLQLVTTHVVAEERQLHEISGITVLYTDEPETSALPISLTEETDTGNNLAYVIYTSGTTGNPKGVMVHHASLVNYITWAAETYLKEADVTFPLFTSISFDLTVTSIFTPLVTGNRILIYEETEGEVLIEKIITDNRSDIIKLTPSHLRIIAASETMPYGESQVKRFIVGGEQLNTVLAKTICDKLGSSLEIYNEYGPTEATVGCMIHRFNKDEAGEVVPIGVPAANTWIYLLDKYLQPVPADVPGEIYISGDALAKGYLFNEVLTTEKFVPNPFVKNTLMYKTGDMATRSAGGIIEYIGRQDQQVKINGHRIELQEIECKIFEYQGVTGVAVAIRNLENGEPILCAYYKSDEVIATSSLHTYLAARLPYYMIPAYFMQLEHIPLTQNAKIDYTALPEPSQAVHAEPQMPANEMEQIMLNVWRDILGPSVMAVTDNFFHLGGDSIKAVQITSRLLEKGIVLKARDMLTWYTIAQISQYATFVGKYQQYAQGVTEGVKTITPIEHWFFAQQLANPDYYNQSVLLVLKKTLPVALLENAFERIIETHDELRMNYDADKQQTFYNKAHLGKQIVIETYEALTPDITGICEAVKRKFDIAHDLLLKAALIQEKQGQTYLFITAHHLVADGISWRILLEDLYTACTALERGTDMIMPQKTASLLEWQQALINYAAGKDYTDAEAFWIKQETDVFTLPADKDTDDWRGKNQEKIQLQLNETATAFLLTDANLVYHTDTSMLLNTALAMALKEWTDAADIVIEQESHGRHLDVNVSRTLGWFTAIYPLCLKLDDDSNPAACIMAVKTAFAAIPDQGMGYGIYQYQRPLNQHRRKTQVRLNYLGQFDHEFDNELFKFSNRSTGLEADPENNLSAVLEINSLAIQGRLYIDFCYNSKSHETATMQWLTQVFMDKLDILQDHLFNEHKTHFIPASFGATLDEQDLNELFN
jgi:amino acid adenylation domain-containing protein/non-ribosomal peptide synthase protein (TIGR01720 family)